MDSDRMQGAARNIGGKIEDVVGGAVGDSKTQAQGKVDKVSGTIQNAYGAAKEAAGEMLDDARESRVGATIQDTARKVSAQASDIGSQVYQKAADAGSYANEQLKEQPLAALAVVGAIAGILGFVMGRASVPEPSLRDYAVRSIPRRYR